MTKYPQYAKIGDKKYKINTDFRIALKCEEIANNDIISDEERSLAIIFLLFGEEALKDNNNYEEFIKMAIKYLNIGKINENGKETETNIDLEQDWGYIQASFFSDYNIDLSAIKMHWWQFYDLLCGLTEKCVLSRVRFVRDFDISQIKDSKEKEKWIRQKQQVAIKKKTRVKTTEEVRLDALFEEQLKGG